MLIVCYHFYPQNTRACLGLVTRLSRHFTGSRVRWLHHPRCQSVIEEIRRSVPTNLEIDFKAYDKPLWEFGAYQEGLNASALESTIILNDTAGINYPFFSEDLQSFIALIRAHQRSELPVVIGKSQQIGVALSVRGLSLDHWIRSNLFFINRNGLTALSGQLFSLSLFQSPVLAGNALSFNGEVCEATSRYLNDWLLGRDTKVNWHKHVGRFSASPALIENKAGSILLEKYLAARILAEGGMLLSYEPPATVAYRVKMRLFYWKKKFIRSVVGRRLHVFGSRRFGV